MGVADRCAAVRDASHVVAAASSLGLLYRSAAVAAALAAGPATLVDAGFESGTDGAALGVRLDALGHPAARRVRHRPRQERHAVGLDRRPDHRRRRRRLRTRRS